MIAMNRVTKAHLSSAPGEPLLLFDTIIKGDD